MNTLEIVLLLIMVNIAIGFASISISAESMAEMNFALNNQLGGPSSVIENQMNRVSSGNQEDFIKNPEAGQFNWFETMIMLGEYAGFMVKLLITSLVRAPGIALGQSGNLFGTVIGLMFALLIIMINALAVLRIWDKFVNKRPD